MKVVTKKIPIYFGYFRIVITNDFEESCKKLKIKTNGLNIKNYGALTLESDFAKDGQFRYTVMLPIECSHSLIAHESVHLVNNLFINTNMQLDRQNDESQAYLTAWFVDEIHKTLDLCKRKNQ